MAREDITVKFNLDDSGFKGGIKRSTAAINRFGKSALGAANKLAKMGLAAAAASLALFARSSLNAAREIGNLARVANTTPEKFQRLSFGAKTVGVDQQKLADIFKDTGDKIGDFLQTGGGPLADFFENIAPKIGVTADMFRDLSGPEALQLYYDSIDRANLSQSEMTFFMEAIASDATLLTPLLKEGGLAFEEFGKQAEESGLIMSDLEQEKLEKVNLKMDVFKKRGTVLAGTFLTKVIPALTILGQGFGFIGDIVGVAAANAIAFGKALGTVVSAAVTPAIGGLKALGLAIKATSQFLSGDVDGAEKSIKQAKAAASETAQEILDIPKKLKAAATELKNSAKSGIKVLGESVGKSSKIIEKAIDDITGASNESEDALVKVIKAAVAAAIEADEIGGDGKGTQFEIEQKLIKMKLAALKAETRGEDELATALNNRIKLAERILEIMKETGATQREATIIANKQVKAELAGDSGSTGGGNADSSSTTATGSGRSRPGSNTGDPSIGKNRVGGVQGNFGGYGSRFGPAPTMDERERAAGLTLRGNNTMSGRAAQGASGMNQSTKSGGSKPDKQLTVAEESARSLKIIETELLK